MTAHGRRDRPAGGGGAGRRELFSPPFSRRTPPPPARCGGGIPPPFPFEPNGYLHIGHCKALTIDFGTAEKYGGLCNLRMDDTNPTKEDEGIVDAIQEDIHWLGFDWGDRFFYGSDYFEEMYARRWASSRRAWPMSAS